MQRSHFVKTITTTFIGILVLFLGATMAVAQEQVNLTAGPAMLTLPDGSQVPMWGYSCDANQVSGSLASCSQLNSNGNGWSPVVITVPSGKGLTINLTNTLSFNGNKIPTSIVIAGQLGGGLGGAPSTNPSPQHENLSTTWPIANTGPVFVPPAQPARVQSFATEVQAGAAQTALPPWTTLQPGTYLLESGTHPSIQVPMGLYGMLVVTKAPASGQPGLAYPGPTPFTGVNYNAEIPLLFSEIDATQNKAVSAAVNTTGFSESATLGPYSAQPLASINLLTPGHDYSSAPSVTFSSTGCTSLGTITCPATATAQFDGDSTSSTYGQVTGFTITNPGNYTSAPTVVISGGGCTPSAGNPCATADAALQLATSSTCSGGASACYPPAVNYTPMYYLINGQAFDKTNPGHSLFAAVPGSTSAQVSGTVLVRMVNAGSHMHVPSIVGSQTGTSNASGFSLIAEDGNPLPGVPRVQSEVFMAAGKTYDVMINVPTGANALPIYDRELSLSGASVVRDAGMLAYISVNGSGAPAFTLPAVSLTADTYSVMLCPVTTPQNPCQALNVSSPSKGVVANDTGVFSVQLNTPPSKGTVTLNPDGTFVYTPNPGWAATDTDTFVYEANGNSAATQTVTLNVCTTDNGCLEKGTGIAMNDSLYNSNIATKLTIAPPGILSVDSDGAGYPLTVNAASVSLPACINTQPATPSPCGAVDQHGGFNIFVASGTPQASFTYQAQNSQGTVSAGSATVTVNFPTANGPHVTVYDGADKTTQITDYRWIIEEDRTFFVDPSCVVSAAGCGSSVINFGTNFHTSNMPVVATGCTGPLSCESGQKLQGQPAVCDIGNGVCRTDGTMQATLDPSQVHLDPTKRYYISVLPGDAANPFIGGNGSAPANCAQGPYNQDGSLNTACGHGMGGAPLAKGQSSVIVYSEPSPYPPATLTVFVFEDDYPLNGEFDAGGGIDVLSPNEPGLGGFQITLQDDAGGTGDATGTPTYDMFNMPLTNALAGTIDPVTGLDACPISSQVTTNATNGDGSQKGITGMIITCPRFESDGQTLSPLAGQAMVKNLYQGRYGVQANAGADRIARGEEWLQTNTLDGQKAHDSFMRIGEPSYFQEFGPAGYHVTIGFANPQIINSRLADICAQVVAGGGACDNEVKGHVTTARMSRTPDERLYGSGTHDSYSFTQCYISLGDPDGADFAFTKCDQDGNFDFKGIPQGNWKITTFDQWNDQVVDGITTAVDLCDTPTSSNSGTVCGYTGSHVLDLHEVAAHQWQANIYTSTFLDLNGNGVRDGNEPGLPLVATNNRFRDGSFSNFNNTDLSGNAGFNEIFPLFNWYVIETDSTRYKNTGTHVVYDAGGPVDGSSPLVNQTATPCLGADFNTMMRPCLNSSIAQNLANTYEANPLPADLHIPGAVYCATADCSSESLLDALNAVPPATGANSPVTNTTGRIDPAWVQSEGWQGFSGQNNFLEFGKKPFAEGENGGIHGHVIYASTRPFDDPQLLLQLSWEPLVPHVRINLYKEGTAPDGITQTLTLVDHTDTTSFDDFAQGFRPDGTPWMNCPGQGTDTSSPEADPFFWAALNGQPQWLDVYANGANAHTMPHNSQFKCYDGMHNWNQIQPVPYDGMYAFPSVTGLDPITGKPTGTYCTACVNNPDSSDPYRFNTPMLPSGKYVVEVVVPPGFELVKEEDKNILIGDNFIAPVTQQFAGLGDVFILPDQAEIATGNSPYNTTQNLGRTESLPAHEGDTGSVETYWPCVGQARIVPDYLSLFPGAAEVSPFAGATRNLCDRKEVQLDDQTAALAKFYIFTSTHLASHFTGIITDDFTAEFDPYSPQFGEKFAPAYLPVSFKDWNGNEVTRVYSDAWGEYNGLNYSTWEVNPPNPTGYGPTMMVGCMNDANMPDPNHPGQIITDPMFQPGYSQFCYELPFMPGQTGYFDTPVVPTSAFAGGYNPPDCAYPDTTPAIASVTGSDGVAGPWVQQAGSTITITALGNQLVDNYDYSGPAASATPFNQQKITRHYDFGAATGTVTVGGVPLGNVQWGQNVITGTVQTSGTDAKGNPVTMPLCTVQQQGYSNTYCGQLVITAANGKQSIDTVTVTVGGKKPTVMATGTKIQTAIDNATPGDMIIVPPGTYSEMLIMWKPVRLQGVGAASSIIDANPHPAGKLDPWRRQMVCLFGLALNGREVTQSNPYDPSSTFSCTPQMQFSIDREPLEATVGWDATLNGNLAEQLIEPTLMGAYEGAGITVLGKGVKFPAGSDPFASDIFPVGTLHLSPADCGADLAHNPYPSSFHCNPSSIDGLSIQDSSQGGGGIYVHAWAHNLQIANNRIRNNQGTMSGGITIGQGEHPDANTAGGTITDPGSCVPDGNTTPGTEMPFCFDINVNVHNNAVVQNASLGDELFSSTPAGAGGVTFCNGSDYYKFNYNWVCGNMSTGDAGGFAHVGLNYDGDIEHNTILYNQATNPTIVANGGGIVIMGAPDVDPPCGLTTDQDCVSAPNTITPSDGTGPGLVINANLILGNSADSGSGGGLRLQHINGNEVLAFPNGQAATTWPTIPGQPAQPAFQTASPWFAVQITNNIIANNVAGWDGGGVSFLDALNVNFVNNTVVSNNSTATSGVLFNSLFAPLASTQNVSTQCTGSANGANSCPQPAGLVSVQDSAVLMANLPTNNNTPAITCPKGHGDADGSCAKYSVPLIANDVFANNRSFVIGVGGFNTGTTSQQKVVTLYNGFAGANVPGVAANSQKTTGVCDPTNESYWDIGVRGDLLPTDHSGGKLAPQYSFLADAGDYDVSNSAVSPAVAAMYCNGSRVPPEAGTAAGWGVIPGTNESNALPAPVFNLMPAATVDEGNNWINLRWGPLSIVNGASNNAALANFTLASGSPAIDYVPVSGPTGGALVPPTDFFGNPRPNTTGTKFDVGAIEYQGPTTTATLTGISPASGYYRGATVAVTLTGTGLTGAKAVNVPATSGVTVSNFTAVNDTTVTATFTIAVTAPLGQVPVTVTAGGDGDETTTPVNITVTNPPVPHLTSISPISDARNTSVSVTLTGTYLATTSAVNVTLTGPGTNGVTASSVQALNDSTVTATFTISSTAARSARSVTVTTLGGTSNSVTFTVGNPTLTTISPVNGQAGTNVPVTLTGVNLTGATAVNVSGNGITRSGITVSPDGTTVTATFGIAINAAQTARTVNVTTPGGTTGNVIFTVLAPPAPTLSSISPTSGLRGTSFPMTLTGTNLLGTSAVNTGINGMSCTVGTVTATTVNASCTLTNAAATGNRNISVTTPGGISNTETFTVNGPTVTGITPTTGVRGTTVAVTITGTNLATATGVTMSGGGVTCSMTGTPTATTVTASCVITTGATASTRNVTVATGIGNATLNNAFTVQGPTLTSISPTSGNRGATNLAVTLTGTNLAGATGVNMSGTGVNCSVNGSTATSISASCSIAGNASTTGTRSVTAVTPIGNVTLTGAFKVN